MKEFDTALFFTDNYPLLQGNRTRKGHSADNLAIIRHIALNLIKREKTSKVGVKIKRLKAGWNNDYLLRVIATI